MGTDPLIDPILKDPSVEVLTCWKQAQEYVLSHGVNRPLDVGISISPSFSYAGEPKYERAVAYMPRRGRELCESVMNTCSSVRYIKIDGMAENEVARVMKSCSIFLATAENEWYGLPALEAMSAGCVVVSVPVLGGMEYLHDGINCRVAGLLEYTGVVAEILSPESMLLRFRLRQNAIATSKTYACTHMINRISRLLNGPLSSWRLC
jgi:glycosyltransferase involved in cell wall biosynthesis